MPARCGAGFLAADYARAGTRRAPATCCSAAFSFATLASTNCPVLARGARGLVEQQRSGSGPSGDVYQLVDVAGYDATMTTQIAVRLDDAEIEALDAEVAQGRASNRSDAVRRSIAQLRREQRYRDEEAILIELSRRGESPYPDLDGILDPPHPQLD